MVIQNGQGWQGAKRVPVPAREGFPEEEQPSCHWENDEELLDMAGRGLVF